MSSINLPEYTLLNLVDINVQFLSENSYLSVIIIKSINDGIFPFLSFCFVFVLFFGFLKQSLIMQPRLTLNSQQFYRPGPTFRDYRYAPPYSAAGPLLFPFRYSSRMLTSCLSICLSVDAAILYVFMKPFHLFSIA